MDPIIFLFSSIYPTDFEDGILKATKLPPVQATELITSTDHGAYLLLDLVDPAPALPQPL